MSLTTSIRNMSNAVGGLSRRSKHLLAWDVFMVWVAIINLWMIVFDLSYLWLRPHYVHYLPVVASVYDPVKGIEPHPLTEALQNEINVTAALLDEAPPRWVIDEHRSNLVELTYRVVHENAFARSGQTRILGIISEALARSVAPAAPSTTRPFSWRHATPTGLTTRRNRDNRLIHRPEGQPWPRTQLLPDLQHRRPTHRSLLDPRSSVPDSVLDRVHDSLDPRHSPEDLLPAGSSSPFSTGTTSSA